jgi:superfamily II RNA helicase
MLCVRLPGMTLAQVRMERNQWLPLVQYLQKRDLLPVTIFSFSRKMASAAAFALATMDLTTAQEKSEVLLLQRMSFDFE